MALRSGLEVDHDLIMAMVRSSDAWIDPFSGTTLS